MKIFPLLLSLVACAAYSEEQRIYQRDAYGNIQYNKPSYVVQKDGRVIQMDQYGNKQYHKQQYQIKGNTAYPVDVTGNAQRNRPSTIKK